MTIWEYSIAREMSRLMQASEQRNLEPKEWRLLDNLMPVLIRIEQAEEDKRLAPPVPKRWW
jgi:hypothetical protein